MILTPREALLLLLDQIDYTRGACSLTDMVGAALPAEVLDKCHETIEATKETK